MGSNFHGLKVLHFQNKNGTLFKLSKWLIILLVIHFTACCGINCEIVVIDALSLQNGHD